LSRLRVESFTISIGGFGAGPNQDLHNPLAVGGMSMAPTSRRWATRAPGTWPRRERPTWFSAALDSGAVGLPDQPNLPRQAPGQAGSSTGGVLNTGDDVRR